jgi:hypothetical protein
MPQPALDHAAARAEARGSDAAPFLTVDVLIVPAGPNTWPSAVGRTPQASSLKPLSLGVSAQTSKNYRNRLPRIRPRPAKLVRAKIAIS